MAKSKSTRLANKASDVVAWKPKPSISIDSRDLSLVKSMEIGKTYTFTVTAKVLALNVGDEYGGYADEDEEREDKSTHARLRITKISEK